MKARHFLLASALLATAATASAKTYVFFTDPMTLGRKMVVIDTPGPDRVLMCMAPPAESGCTELRPSRR